MIRTLSIATALAATALLSPVAAIAQSGAYYSAEPVNAPTKPSVITSGTLWKCAGNTCTAPKSTQRDAIMCQLVVQRLGALKSFTVNGQAVDGGTLKACNERAG